MRLIKVYIHVVFGKDIVQILLFYWFHHEYMEYKMYGHTSCRSFYNSIRVSPHATLWHIYNYSAINYGTHTKLT